MAFGKAGKGLVELLETLDGKVTVGRLPQTQRNDICSDQQEIGVVSLSFWSV